MGYLDDKRKAAERKVKKVTAPAVDEYKKATGRTDQYVANAAVRGATSGQIGADELAADPKKALLDLIIRSGTNGQLDSQRINDAGGRLSDWFKKQGGEISEAWKSLYSGGSGPYNGAGGAGGAGGGLGGGLSGGVGGTNTTEALKQLQDLNGTLGAANYLPSSFKSFAADPVSAQLAQIGAVDNISLGAASPYQAQQLAFADTLRQQATGQAPSLAEAVLTQQREQQMAQNAALAASIPGRSQAVAQRQLLNQANLGGQQLAQSAAIARLQEQQGAQEAYSRALEAFRGQDIQRTQLGVDVDKSNQSTALQRALEQGRLNQSGFNTTANISGEAARAEADQKYRSQADFATARLNRDKALADINQNILTTGSQDARVAAEIAQRDRVGAQTASDNEMTRRNQLIGSLIGGGAAIIAKKPPGGPQQ